MNAEHAVPRFVVLRDKIGKYTIEQRGTRRFEEESVGKKVVYEGSETDCNNWRSPGAVFKAKFGYSRTTARIMKRLEGGIEDYKRKRKQAKQLKQASTRAKRDRARAGRKTKTIIKK